MDVDVEEAQRFQSMPPATVPAGWSWGSPSPWPCARLRYVGRDVEVEPDGDWDAHLTHLNDVDPERWETAWAFFWLWASIAKENLEDVGDEIVMVYESGDPHARGYLMRARDMY